MRLETLPGAKGLYPASRATPFRGGGDYDGHAVSLWCKSTRGVVANEPRSNSQGLYREV